MKRATGNRWSCSDLEVVSGVMREDSKDVKQRLGYEDILPHANSTVTESTDFQVVE